MKKREVYIKIFHCPNCEESYSKTFDYGTPAMQSKCPHCGVTPERYNRGRKLEK